MIFVLALGNPLRGDDGVGPVIARELVEALGDEAEVVESHEVLPEHAELLARAEAAVFLDASVAGQPGEVRAGVLVARAPRPAVLHALTPEELVGMARAAFGAAPPAILVTVAGKEFGFVEQLSPEVEAAVPEARARAVALLARLPRR